MPFTEMKQSWVYAVAAIALYLLVMFFNPARASLRDGIRCLRRYGTLWSMLVLFGLCYAIFQIGVEVFYHYNLPEGERPVFQWARPWFLPAETLVLILKKSSVLPAVEGVAGLFNVLITTFPFSAVAALMFLFNWEGHNGVLFRALRRRFDGWGWAIYGGILLCAVAAIVKVLLYSPAFLILNKIVPGLRLVQCGLVVDWLSFLFEIMFGTCVQIYLILMVYAWVRGLNFTHQHLMDFAIRRFGSVMKWSAVVLLLSSLSINLPLILSNVPPFSHHLSPDLMPIYVEEVARPVLAAFLILFSGVQIILTFHSESLVKALRDYFRFILKDAWPIGWFLLIAFVHFYFLNVLNTVVNSGFANHGDLTAITITWRLLYPLLSAFVSGWLLASWVCLYKRSEAGRIHAGDWIKY